MKLRITSDHAIFASLVLVAALVRIWNLGSIPLQPGEAAVALPSWWMYRGLPSTVELGPLITYGNALIFSIFGANDASARLLPSLAGCILVWLCYFTRPYVGSSAAIAGALILAISPIAVFFSRFVGSEILASTAVFGAVVLVFRYLGGRGPASLYGAAAVTALGVTASVTAFVDLAIVALFVGIFWFLRWLVGDRLMPALGTGREVTDGGVTNLVLNWDGRLMRNAGLIFVAVVVLVATGLFSNLRGFQEGIVGPLFLQTSPLIGAAGYSPVYYTQILIIYETLVVAFAFARVLYSSRPKGLFSWFLVWWALASLLFFSILPQKSAMLAIQPLVPATLLAGEMIGELIGWAQQERQYGDLARRLGVLVLVAFPPLLGLVHVLSRFSLPSETMKWEFAILLLVVLALAIAGFIAWRGATETSRLGGIFLFALLLVAYVHVGSNLNHRGELSPAELLVPAVAVEDVRNLAADLADMEQIAGDPSVGKGIFVQSRFQLPLAWYLRQNDRIEYGPEPSGNPSIVVAKEGFPVEPGSRATQRYLVLASWEPRPTQVTALWRWLAYREASGPVRYEVAEVSVRR